MTFGDADRRSPQLADSRLYPGRILAGRWKLLRQIGRGGMASVWAAVDGHRGPVALKILHDSLTHDTQIRRRFRQESYCANSIRHAGVTPVIEDVETTDGIVFLVMTLLEGATLRSLLREQGVFPEVRVVAIALDVLDVLDAADAAGIVHRDIKPDNIFLTTNDEVRVLDFGIARLLPGSESGLHTSAGAVLGTPAFMAPEQALGHHDVIDGRCDVYAVAATMWWLLTGQFVHHEKSFQLLLIAAGTQSARPIREVAPGLKPAIAHVIDQALSFDKGDRWSTAGHMRRALVAAIEGTAEAVTLHPPLRQDDQDGHGWVHPG